MPKIEYKVIPAPKKGLKGKGKKGSEARFANALEALMNEHGAEGWEYVRTDTLPVEERLGLTGRATVFQNMLVFRRNLDGEVVASAAEPEPRKFEPEPAPEVAETPEPEPAPEPEVTSVPLPKLKQPPSPMAKKPPSDDGRTVFMSLDSIPKPDAKSK